MSENPVFKISAFQDSIFLASAAAFKLGSSILPSPSVSDKKKSDINLIDRRFMHSYDFNWDVTSWVLISALGAGQLALNFTAESQEWKEVLIMSLETILISDGIKSLTKNTVGKKRPYTYFSSSPNRNDENESFLSGHSINGFAIASFTSYVFSQYYPDSAWKWAVTGVAFSLATLTAYGRVQSGCHFVSDVVCGAAIGSAVGFLVPYFHRKNAINHNKKTKLAKKSPEFYFINQGFLVLLWI